MTENDASSGVPRMSDTPNPALRRLDRLVGTWDVAGDDIAGRVTFAWMEGGFFLTQTVDLVHGGRRISGVEYIGYDPASGRLTSHYFGNQELPFTYDWEVEGDALTIWGGSVGSAARYLGTFSPDGTVNAGRWEWPGGGYASTMTKMA